MTVCVAAATLALGCEGTYDVGPRFERIGGEAFGTTYEVKADISAAAAKELATEIEAELSDIDSRLSTWNPDSQLARFNRSGVGEATPIALETRTAIELAMSLRTLLQGAFDPAVGPMVELWNFGSRRSSGRIDPPSDKQVAEAQAIAAADGFRIETEPRLQIVKGVAGYELDLSAIAKGDAVDRIALLCSGPSPHWMVEIGGEVRVSPSRPDGSPWRIGVVDPSDPLGRRPLRIVPLRDFAMATSGDYRNFQRIGDRTVSHTIDPRTGRPVDNRLASVTVLHHTCAFADAAATALMVMGPDEGLAWARSRDVACLLVVRPAEGNDLEVMASPEFDRLVAEMARPLPPSAVRIRHR